MHAADLQCGFGGRRAPGRHLVRQPEGTGHADRRDHDDRSGKWTALAAAAGAEGMGTSTDGCGERLRRSEDQIRSNSRVSVRSWRDYRFMHSNRTATLATDLLLYVGSRLNLDEAARLGEHLDGIVLSGAGAYARARQLRLRGYERDVLVDPAEYANDEPESPQLSLDVGLDPSTLQHEARTSIFLAPSCEYVHVGDEGALARVIERGQFLCQSHESHESAMVLPLDSRWLSNGVARLLGHLRGVDTSVALVLGDPNDPLGRKGAVEGLLAVLKACPGTMLLRSDLGAVGALANGARLAAIGLTTTHRHAVRRGGFAGGRRGDRALRVIHPILLTFFSGEVLERVRHVDPGCDCAACEGAPLARFGDGRLREEANRHNVLIWRRFLDQILDVPAGNRSAAWWQLCQHALSYEEVLQDRAGTNALQVDTQVRRWAKIKP